MPEDFESEIDYYQHKSANRTKPNNVLSLFLNRRVGATEPAKSKKQQTRLLQRVSQWPQ
jgi:hypothetical protein